LAHRLIVWLLAPLPPNRHGSGCERLAAFSAVTVGASSCHRAPHHCEGRFLYPHLRRDWPASAPGLAHTCAALDCNMADPQPPAHQRGMGTGPNALSTHGHSEQPLALWSAVIGAYAPMRVGMRSAHNAHNAQWCADPSRTDIGAMCCSSIFSTKRIARARRSQHSSRC
jgi:hypothetical protein